MKVAWVPLPAPGAPNKISLMEVPYRLSWRGSA